MLDLPANLHMTVCVCVCVYVCICAQTTAYCAISHWTNMAPACGGRAPETDWGTWSARGRRDGEMDTGRKADRENQRGTMQHQHTASQTHTHTHPGSKTLAIVNIKAACHWWCALYLLTPTPPSISLSPTLPAWAWDKNAARHQVLLWQQRTAQVRIIWTDAIVNENNKTGDYKHEHILDQLPDVHSSRNPHHSWLRRGEGYQSNGCPLLWLQSRQWAGIAIAL